MNTVTVPDAALIPAAVAMTIVVLSLAALSLNRTSTRRRLDLSPISTRTNRSDCPHPGCTTVHPGSGRHRADPRPDRAITIIIAALACGLGIINNPKGQHYDHWR